MKNKENMLKYISNLAVLSFKVHNLHWNVVGSNFMQIHKYTEDLYEKCFSRFDDTAELIKMQGELPPVMMSYFVDTATIKELPAKEFNVKEVLDIIKEDTLTMKALAEKIREEAIEEDDFVVVATFEEYIGSYNKDLWFLNAMMKQSCK